MSFLPKCVQWNMNCKPSDMLAIAIIWILIAAVFIFAMKKARSSKSKLSIFTHPDNFEKPPIEMVNTAKGPSDKDEGSDIAKM